MADSVVGFQLDVLTALRAREDIYKVALALDAVSY